MTSSAMSAPLGQAPFRHGKSLMFIGFFMCMDWLKVYGLLTEGLRRHIFE